MFRYSQGDAKIGSPHARTFGCASPRRAIFHSDVDVSHSKLYEELEACTHESFLVRRYPENDYIRADDHLVLQIEHGFLSSISKQIIGRYLAETFEQAVEHDFEHAVIGFQVIWVVTPFLCTGILTEKLTAPRFSE